MSPASIERGPTVVAAVRVCRACWKRLLGERHESRSDLEGKCHAIGFVVVVAPMRYLLADLF